MAEQDDSLFSVNASREAREGDLIAIYGEYLALFDQKSGAVELRGKVDLVGACWLRGALYAIDDTAGLVPNGSGQVVGELYEILDPACLKWIDSQIARDCEENGIRFERRVVDVIEPETHAWAYVWGHEEVASGRAIPTGDWRGHIGELGAVAVALPFVA